MWRHTSALLDELSHGAPNGVSLGDLHDAATRSGAFPTRMDIKAYCTALALLSPVVLDISMSSVPPTGTGVPYRAPPWETSEVTWMRSLMVRRQPWIPASDASATEGGTAFSDASSMGDAALLRLVPTYYVSLHRLEQAVSADCYSGSSHCSWAEFLSAAHASPLLDWTPDKLSVRLASFTSASSLAADLFHVRGEGGGGGGQRPGPADDRYKLLQPGDPSSFHAALGLLAGVVPTFFTPVADRAMRSLFESKRLPAAAAPLEQHGFPNVESLLSHPDLRFALEFRIRGSSDQSEAPPLCCSPGQLVRLRPDYAHCCRGTADRFYTATSSDPVGGLAAGGAVTSVPVGLTSYAKRNETLDAATASVVAVSFAPSLTADGVAVEKVEVCVALGDATSGVDAPVRLFSFLLAINGSGTGADSPCLPAPLQEMLADDSIIKVISAGHPDLAAFVAGLPSADPSSARAAAGTLAALCQFVGFPVGETALAFPNLHAHLCSRLGLAPGWADAPLPSEAQQAAAATLLVARALLPPCQETADTIGRDNRIREWRRFLSMAGQGRSDHACTTRLQRYLRDHGSETDSGVPATLGSLLPPAALAGTLAEKEQLLKELVFMYGPEVAPRAAARELPKVSPPQPTAAVPPLVETTQGPPKPLTAAAPPPPPLPCTAVPPDGGGGGPAEFDAMEALLEEAGRLQRSPAAPAADDSAADPQRTAMATTAAEDEDDVEPDLLDALMPLPECDAASADPVAEPSASADDDGLLSLLPADPPESARPAAADTPRRVASGRSSPWEGGGQPIGAAAPPADRRFQRGPDQGDTSFDLPPSFTAGPATGGPNKPVRWSSSSPQGSQNAQDWAPRESHARHYAPQRQAPTRSAASPHVAAVRQEAAPSWTMPPPAPRAPAAPVFEDSPSLENRPPTQHQQQRPPDNWHLERPSRPRYQNTSPFTLSTMAPATTAAPAQQQPIQPEEPEKFARWRRARGSEGHSSRPPPRYQPRDRPPISGGGGGRDDMNALISDIVQSTASGSSRMIRRPYPDPKQNRPQPLGESAEALRTLLHSDAGRSLLRELLQSEE